MSDTEYTQSLIKQLRHLVAGCENVSEAAKECHIAKRAADELERLTKITIPEYQIDEFRPLMRLAKQKYSTFERPLFEWAETFQCQDITFQKGDTCDFSSRPWMFKLFINQIGDDVGADAVHDEDVKRALKLKSYNEWVKATARFKENLIKCKTNKNRIKIMVAGVAMNGYQHKLMGKLK